MHGMNMLHGKGSVPRKDPKAKLEEVKVRSRPGEVSALSPCQRCARLSKSGDPLVTSLEFKL